MDIFNALSCLVSNGNLEASQDQDLKDIMKSLPDAPSELLKMIAAMTLLGTGSSNVFSGTSISATEVYSSSPTSPVSLTSIPYGASKAIITVYEDNIIFRLDGGTPEANRGHYAAIGSNFSIGNLADFEFCSASGTGATIFVTYF